MQINDLKNFNADRLDIHDLVALEVFGSHLRSGYEKHSVEEPDWLDVQLKAVRREISSRNTDALLARKKQIEARLESLQTPDEKRAKLQQELADLDSKLRPVA